MIFSCQSSYFKIVVKRTVPYHIICATLYKYSHTTKHYIVHTFSINCNINSIHNKTLYKYSHTSKHYIVHTFLAF